MNHKRFLRLVKKHRGWIEGDAARFPTVHDKEQFEKEPEYTLHECYNKIINASNSRSGARGQLLDYAATYAGQGLRYPDAECAEELTNESHSQALYVRANLSGWRSSDAKLVRESIDKILKGK